MAFIDKAKQWMDKSLEASKSAINKAGNAVQDFGDKSVTRIEIKKLESDQDKLFIKLGELVYSDFTDKALESLASTDKDVSEIITEISKVKSDIDEKQKMLKKE